MFSSDDFGFLAIYDSRGNMLAASREELLSIERLSFDTETHCRVVGNLPGSYWLISDRPGFCAVLLEVVIDYTASIDRWEISYYTDSIADSPDWDLEAYATAYNQLAAQEVTAMDGYTPIPENVLAIARQRVSYRPGPRPSEVCIL